MLAGNAAPGTNVADRQASRPEPPRASARRRARHGTQRLSPPILPYCGANLFAVSGNGEAGFRVPDATCTGILAADLLLIQSSLHWPQFQVAASPDRRRGR